MTLSGLILVACCIVAAIWDLFAVNAYGVKYSVSWWIRQSAISHPTLLLAIGCLIGHFFAAMSPPNQSGKS